MSIRPVKQIIESKPTIEGAGVKLRRAFGFGDTSEFDPFLLLDDFRNDRPEDYRAGFPWHPHRGIETITYVLAGTVEHGDSLGNKGNLGAGDVQWMTAGRGIMHQEMPQGDAQGRMHGFQLWANLPSSLKMTAPRYQDVKAAEIPEVIDDDGTRVRVICGDFWGKRGPVEGVAADPRYLDVWVPPGKRKTLAGRNSRARLCLCVRGLGQFPRRVATVRRADREGPTAQRDAGPRADRQPLAGAVRQRRRGDGAGRREGIRFLLVSGKPIEEPVAWYGPIVMNTEAELQQAVTELRNGTFISNGGPQVVGDTHRANALTIDQATGALQLHGAAAALPSRPIHCSVDASGAVSAHGIQQSEQRHRASSQCRRHDRRAGCAKRQAR